MHRAVLRLAASLTLAAAILTGSGTPPSAGEPVVSHPATAQPADHIGYITNAELTSWLAAYGLDDEHARGELVIRVKPALDRAAGLYQPSDESVELSAATGLSPWVLAHEVGHWLQGRHPETHLLGAAVPDLERNADCVAVVLLTGTDFPPEIKDCSRADIELAGQVIAGTPLSIARGGSATSQQLRARQAPSPYTSGWVDAYGTYATRAEIMAVRDAAGLPAAHRPLPRTRPTLELARAYGTPAPAWVVPGREVYIVDGLRLDAGTDLLALGDGAWAVDPRALGEPEVDARIDAESPRNPLDLGDGTSAVNPLANGWPPEVDARIGAESDGNSAAIGDTVRKT